MLIRSFLAFELPPDMKRIVSRVSGEAKTSNLDVRWVNPGNIHLTVVFLGSINRGDIPQMRAVIQGVVSQYNPFHISLKGVGLFPNRRRPRVLWLGLHGDIERISYLKDALQEQLTPFGIKEEKRTFKPHLTLGRFRKTGRGNYQLDDFLERYAEVSSPVCSLKELVQFQSDLGPGGATYTKLESWPLSGADA
jgi:2'-5' RNA ligase